MIIFKPQISNHSGDTFRELIDLWKQFGLCEVRESPDAFCWANAPGEVLLYDHPRLDDWGVPEFKQGLFGNTVPAQNNCHPWIFWARSPRLLWEARKRRLPNYEERTIGSIFLGKIENDIQKNNRQNQDWSAAGLDIFYCPVSQAGQEHYPFSKMEYLEKLRCSKFGLCLAGYGPKCNREIELLGMGVVPLFAPEVDNTYHEPLVEGQHFFRVETSEAVKPLIDSVSKQRWEEMSKAGLAWYSRNASIQGSFQTTKRIIDAMN